MITREEVIKRLEGVAKEIAELKADLATIKAQLQKPVPNGAILTEAGKSVRSIAEGIVAGMMTSRAIQSVSELVRALGLS